MDIRELKLLAEFSHPNIVKFVSVAGPERSNLYKRELTLARDLYTGR